MTIIKSLRRLSQRCNLARSWNAKSVFELIFDGLDHSLDIWMHHLIVSILMAEIDHSIYHLVLFLLIYAWNMIDHWMVGLKFCHHFFWVIVHSQIIWVYYGWKFLENFASVSSFNEMSFIGFLYRSSCVVNWTTRWNLAGEKWILSAAKRLSSICQSAMSWA